MADTPSYPMRWPVAGRWPRSEQRRDTPTWQSRARICTWWWMTRMSLGNCSNTGEIGHRFTHLGQGRDEIGEVGRPTAFGNTWSIRATESATVPSARSGRRYCRVHVAFPLRSAPVVPDTYQVNQ